MGVSSDGMLYFGFIVGGDDEKPEWLGEYDDLDDLITDKAELTDAPYENRRAFVDACPADLRMFCSYDYPMYVLSVRGAEHRVSRGYNKEISVADLTVEPERIQAFKAWCEENSIEYQEPKWLLCSMYG